MFIIRFARTQNQTGVITMDQLQFDVINKALQSSTLALENEGIASLDQAKEDLLQALSIAMSVDKVYLTRLADENMTYQNQT